MSRDPNRDCQDRVLAHPHHGEGLPSQTQAIPIPPSVEPVQPMLWSVLLVKYVLNTVGSLKTCKRSLCFECRCKGQDRSFQQVL